MNLSDARNMTFNDAIPADRDEGDFSVVACINANEGSLRFLTGRFSPENLAGQIVWFPMIGSLLNTISEIYRLQNVRLTSPDWSSPQPYFNNLHELGQIDPAKETRKSDESMIVFTGKATWFDDE